MIHTAAQLSMQFPKTLDKVIKYGTAGLRMRADQLDFIVFRMGLLAALRSLHQKAAIGVMITASHNPVEENGVKLIDPMGEMLAAEWEDYGTLLANVPDTEVEETLQKIIADCCIGMEGKAVVLIGRDTRPSSGPLQAVIRAALGAMSAEVVDYGEVSTPILHYAVHCHNGNDRYGIPTEEGYYKKLSNAFNTMRKEGTVNRNYKPEILFDGANGVGTDIMMKFMSYLNGYLKITMHNSGDGVLNYMCGADFVKTHQKWPHGVPEQKQIRCVSVDGDVDRIIYSYLDEKGIFHILDGDKMATLVAGYIQSLNRDAGLNLKLGLVQTAYANGASTEYIIEKLGIPVSCAKTGVKHLHHAALQFDIGVYFEANGHGTVLFSKKAKDAISAGTEAKNASAEKLAVVMDMINETVGDALSDLLLIETVLLDMGWSIEDWEKQYTDLPNKLLQVSVADRSIITTTDAERKCVTPSGLQDTIGVICKKYLKARSFVRPSGTEDIVRVYAEAESNAEQLALEVAQAVYDQAVGIGNRPQAL